MANLENEYISVMEKLYCEYEKSCRILEKRIGEVCALQSGVTSCSKEYKELYNRIRRLKRCLNDTREWQDMVRRYLLAGGESREALDLLVK